MAFSNGDFVGLFMHPLSIVVVYSKSLVGDWSLGFQRPADAKNNLQ